MGKYGHLNCSGAYGIIYKPDMKFKYIGCAININKRWRDHRTQTRYDDDFHKDLRANHDKYECVVLYEYDGIIKDQHDLYKKLVPIECFLIEHFKLLGHPIVTTVENQIGKASKGRRHSKESKAKMSAAHTGEKNPMFGHTGEKNPMYGKHHSKESIEKMRAAKIGCTPWNKGKTSTFTWMHDDERNYQVPKGQEKQKEQEGLVYGKIRVNS